jgi:chemotaxis family two-component system response regulator Rcp1
MHASQELVGRPMEILLVEDNCADARLTVELLREGNIKHRMSWVWDGIEALEFLRHQGIYAQAPRPDLIFLDLSLPRLDGRELLELLREDLDLKSIPVVVMTASQSHEDYLRGESLEVESYIVKPVDVEKFLEVVKELRRFWRADMLLFQLT